MWTQQKHRYHVVRSGWRWLAQYRSYSPQLSPNTAIRNATTFTIQQIPMSSSDQVVQQHHNKNVTLVHTRNCIRQLDTTIPAMLTTTTTNNFMQRRWMGAPNKHNRKKKIEKQIPEKETKKPEMTDRMKEELATLERRFERLDKERFGRNRGIECARQIILEEKLEKRATKACANVYLNNWLYRRYALRLGYRKITDVPGDVLANTLIREGTDVRFHKHKNPKTIIKELYRYDNKSPMQERYLLKDKQLMGTEYDPETLNFDTEEFLTPYEEEEDKILLQRAMLDTTLYKPNPTRERRTEIARNRNKK